MVGSTIKVVATAESGNTFESEATEEVGVYEALEILSAEQTGQYTAEVTFSAPISADDKLEVTKGGNKVAFESAIDSDKLGAELTFTDALTDGEYTVTLTPADKDVDPSSVTFEGQKTVLYEIVFLSKELVMKDHYYNEGYAYIEGRDQWGKKKNLSGINVISGVGTFQSYDSDTGKITIKDDTVAANQTGAFLTIKEVPVFVQYQEGTTVVSQNETLTVSTRAYVDELEFGEIKKNSTEQAKRLTLDELSSGLYYVEILDAKDQYGNALSADDLQDQVDDKVLFVIPGDTGAFYTTGKFGELNGKTVLWLDDNNGNAKPGKMDLSITGAGGKTFKKEAVEIFDNPYIDTLTVDYPDLYEGMTESKQLNFSAIDQYNDPINLWDFRPVSNNDGGTTNVGGTTLVFGDQNAMTTRQTEIKISGGANFNIVEIDTKAKTFKVTVDVTDKKNLNLNAMKAKDMAVFTITTAGTKVRTRTITIGERGKAAKVSSSFASTKKLDPGTIAGKWNINEDIEFVDVNGNVMTRHTNNADYPYFINGYAGITATTDPATGNTVRSTLVTDAALANDAVITKYLWTVSEEKITNAATALAATYDTNGEVEVLNGTAQDYYITVYAVSGGRWYIIDSASTRVSTKADDEEKIEVVAPGKLYASTTSTDTETFKVKITNKVGESWKVNASSIVVGGDFAGHDGSATLSGKLASDLPGDTTKTTPVSVYYGGDLVGTVDLTYTNVDPVPTTTKFKYTVAETGTDGTEDGRAGVGFTKDIEGSEFNVDDDDYAAYSVDAKGHLKITFANDLGDTFEGWVVDQYDQDIAGTVVYLNGVAVTDGMTVPAKRNIWEFKNGDQGKSFYMTEDTATTVSVAAATTSKVVDSQAKLAAAMADASVTEVHVAFGDTLATAAVLPTTITKNIVIDQGFIAKTNGATTLSAGADLTVSGTLSVGHGITSALGDEVILKDGAELDFTAANLGIDSLNIPGKDVVISVNAGGDKVVESFVVSGHAFVTGGTLTAGDGNYTGTVVNISGTSIDIDDGAAVALDGASVTSVTSFNMGTNAGKVIVNNKAQLKAVIENTTAVGTIQIGTALADATADTYNVTSTKGVTLDINNTAVAGEIINNGILKVTSSTAGGTVAKLTTTGTTVIGDGTNAVTVADLVSEDGAETTLSSAGVITALTGTTGGDLAVEAGGTIGTTVINQDATVEDITATTTAADVVAQAKIEVVAGKVTGDTTADTDKELKAAMKAAVGEDPNAAIAITQTSGQNVVKGCAYAYISNLDSSKTYDIIFKVDGKYYAAASDLTSKTTVQLCYAGDFIGSTSADGLGLATDYSDEKLATVTEMWIVANADNIAAAGTETAPTAFLAKVNFDSGVVTYPTAE